MAVGRPNAVYVRRPMVVGDQVGFLTEVHSFDLGRVNFKVYKDFINEQVDKYIEGKPKIQNKGNTATGGWLNHAMRGEKP